MKHTERYTDTIEWVDSVTGNREWHPASWDYISAINVAIGDIAIKILYDSGAY